MYHKKNILIVSYVDGEGGPMCLEEALLFNDRNEWRSWLEKNHRNTKEVWLLHYKKQSKKQTLKHIDAVEEALCFGWIDSKLKKIDQERYILKYSPRKQKSVWSKINKENAEKMIASRKNDPSGFRKNRRSKKTWIMGYRIYE